jgi:hypothetical protein
VYAEVDEGAAEEVVGVAEDVVGTTTTDVDEGAGAEVEGSTYVTDVPAATPYRIVSLRSMQETQIHSHPTS